jgi:hypothetical protein
MTSNENKMSDGGRGAGVAQVRVWKSFLNVDLRRSAVRSIAWLGLKFAGFMSEDQLKMML